MTLTTDDEPIVYLDNAATTFPKPEIVYQEMDRFYRRYGGNAGRGANPLARKSAALVEETRAMLIDWLDTPAAVFQPSATIALNTVIQGAGLRPSDAVYVTPFEHNSVLRPLEHLRKTIGIEVRLIPFDRETFECDLEQTAGLFQIEPPTMICVTQVSNVFGIAPPVDELLIAARHANPDVVTLVDGAQAAGLRALDMSRVDALVFSGHKSLYGPYGIAGIALGGNWRPLPLLHGGTGTQSESVDMPMIGLSRFEVGSHNIGAIAGLSAALRWLNDTGKGALNAHIDALTQKLIETLSGIGSVQGFASPSLPDHAGIASFTVAGASPQSVETALGAQRIAVRAGLHCAPWAHEFAGTASHGGTIRASVGFLNSQRDIDQFYLRLKKVVSPRSIHI